MTLQLLWLEYEEAHPGWARTVFREADDVLIKVEFDIQDPVVTDCRRAAMYQENPLVRDQQGALLVDHETPDLVPLPVLLESPQLLLLQHPSWGLEVADLGFSGWGWSSRCAQGGRHESTGVP